MSEAKSKLSAFTTHTAVTRLNKRVGQWAIISASVGVLLSAAVGHAYAQSQPETQPDSQMARNPSHQPDSQTGQPSVVDRLMQQAMQKGLATHQTWLRLHYYEEKGYAEKDKNESQAYRSNVERPEFFLSESGRDDPQAELRAFISTLVSERSAVNRKTDANHATPQVACRFPARTHWVSSQLGLEDIDYDCPELDAWMTKLDPQRLSVVFAEEYPDRAVSAFGHTLMLIDSSESLANPEAIDTAHALNDTVGGNPDDPFVVYAIKSTFGGYPNEITIEPYPKKLAEYVQQDNRDVWTYALDLSKDEIDQIMRHVWETKDLELPYYFTVDNCASEILRYIDVVRPESNLLDEFKVAIVPSDVVRLLDKEGLITQQRYVPADTTLAQAKLNDSRFNELPSSSITAESKLDIARIDAITPSDNNTLNGHGRQRVMLGVGEYDDSNYISIAYRGGFSGLLDRQSGYPQNFHLETGSVEFRLFEDDNQRGDNQDRLELEQLIVLNGRSFNPMNTAGQGDSALASWGVSLGAIQVEDGSQMDRVLHTSQTDNRHLVANIGYEKGVSAAFGTPKAGTGEMPPHLCYAFGTGMAQLGKSISKGYRVGAGLNLGCRYQFGSRARIVGELQLPYWYHGNSSSRQVKSHYWQPLLKIGVQYDFSKDQALRLQSSYELHDNIEAGDNIQLAFVNYF